MPGFSKDERLLKSCDFSTAYKIGKKASSRYFFVAWIAGEKRRLGITVSSKVGNACVRNKIKRVIRDFFRLNKEKFPLGDCVVTAKVGAGDLDNKEIREELGKILCN